MSKDQPSSVLTWKASDQPVAVQISHSVVERMSVEMMRGFGITRRRGTEIGGILLGHVKPGPEALISITDFEAVPCEYSQGPSYILSASDLAKFQEALQSRNGAGGTSAIGYFRSHTREGLHLDDNDLHLFENHFGTPAIALVVKPYATRTPEAAIFLPGSGKPLNLEPTPPQFHFTKSSSAPAVNQLTPTPAPPERTETREPVQAPMIEEASVPPARWPQASPPSEPSRVDVPNPPREVVAKGDRPADFSFDFRSTLPEVPRRIPEGDALFFKSIEPPPRPWRPILSWTAFILAAIGFGAVLGYHYAGGQMPSLRRPQAQPVVARSSPFVLGLKANQQANGILVSWNRNAESVQGALRGVLTVAESGGSKRVDLVPAELKNGNVIYHNLSDQVVFTLEVYLTEQQRLVETVRGATTEIPKPTQ